MDFQNNYQKVLIPSIAYFLDFSAQIPQKSKDIEQLQVIIIAITKKRKFIFVDLIFIKISNDDFIDRAIYSINL